MKVVFLIVFVVSSQWLQAQNADEWFHQKRTKIKYLLQQIAANKVYIDYLEKGYKVAMNGLQVIDDVKHGDFKLHNNYFNSLLQVNPKVKALSKVAEIISMQAEIIKQVKSAGQHIRSSEQFTATEIEYMQNVFNRILDESKLVLDKLIEVISSGNVSMKDDERIEVIDSIYKDVQGQLSFSKSFTYEASMLAMQRMNEKVEVDVSRKLSTKY